MRDTVLWSRIARELGILSVFMSALWWASLGLFPAEGWGKPPPGQSALLNGMHDIESAKWMLTATPGCDKGWVTTLRYIGHTGTPAIDCYTQYTKAGLSIIMRLDYSGPQSFPLNKAHIPGYAKNFATYVRSCPNIRVWIVGNEPNFTVNKSDPDCSSSQYAEAYVAVHRAVHAIPGRGNDLVLVAPNSPYSPGCIESLRQIVKNIRSRGVTPDGFAIHAYTRADFAHQLSPSHVTNNRTLRDVTRDECPGPARWNDVWYYHFRIYINYIQAIEALGLAGKPVFITESGNACKVQGKNACYPDKDIGYFQALYAEVNRWNSLPSTRTKIRAITPYRWTIYDDGTGRDFEIGRRKNLLRDLKKAFAKRYSWTTPGCPGSGCKKDSDCPAGKKCQLSTGLCITPPKKCSSNSDCKGGEICTPPNCPDNSGICTPRGTGTFGFPSNLKPNTSFTATFQHPTGYAYIAMEFCGPTSGKGKFLKVDKAPNGEHRWHFQIPPLPAGVYRFQFTANNRSIVVGRTSLLVSNPNQCPENARRCGGSSLEVCRQGRWQREKNCPFGCRNNRCNDCAEGSRRCGVSWVEVCRQGRWQKEKNCPFGCRNNRCNDCAEGSRRCGVSSLEVCRQGRWQREKSCPFGCRNNRCNNCKKNSRKCDGNILQICTNSGGIYDWRVLEQCQFGCRGGRCLPCPPGSPKCGEPPPRPDANPSEVFCPKGACERADESGGVGDTGGFPDFVPEPAVGEENVGEDYSRSGTDTLLGSSDRKGRLVRVNTPGGGDSRPQFLPRGGCVCGGSGEFSFWVLFLVLVPLIFIHLANLAES